MKAIITVGISGSGKSTWAADFIASERKQGRHWIEVNRDAIRFNVVAPNQNWSTYKFSKLNEKRVTEIAWAIIEQAAYDKANVVISDTNLNQVRLAALKQALVQFGFEVEVKMFDVDFDTCVKRDQLRANSVGETVIYRQYQQFLTAKGRRKYEPDRTLPNAVIFDVDGTLADMTGVRTPFEWDKVHLDRIRPEVLVMLHGYENAGYEIIVLSGRDGCCAEETIQWLNRHSIYPSEFFIRKAGDTRKDTEIKEELFWQYIAPRYNVCAVVDDRPCVYRMWMELEIPNVIMVGNAYVEF